MFYSRQGAHQSLDSRSMPDKCAPFRYRSPVSRLREAGCFRL